MEVGTVPSPGTAGASPESLDRGPPGGMAGKLSPPARLAEPGEAPQGTIRGTASGKERGSSHQCPIGLLSPASASTWSAAPGQQLEHKRSSPPIDTPLHRRWDGLWADRRTSCVNPFIHAVLGGRVIRTSTNTAAGSIWGDPPGDDPLRALAAQRVSPAPRLQRQYFRGAITTTAEGSIRGNPSGDNLPRALTATHYAGQGRRS